MAFINGIRTRSGIAKKTTTSGVDYSVIGLIGTAPMHEVKEEYRTKDTPVLITDREEGVKYFGQAKAGYTIPQALDAIFTRLSSAKVIVINVFDSEEHTSEDNKGKTVVDPTKVTASDIIGNVDTEGNRTGLQAFKDALALCKYKPRIIIAPEFSNEKTVVTALETLAENFRAFVYADKAIGESVKQAIVRKEDVASKRVEYVYPRFKVFNSVTGEYEYRAASSYAAATRVYTDTIEGMHYSIGNQDIKGIEGLETPVYFDIQDENSDSNLLNGNGITTAIYDEGFRFWGNRNSSFPDNENIDSFSNEVRIADYIDESIAVKSRQFMAGPITTSTIDSIVNFGNDFMAALKTKGWLISFECWYDPSKNDYQSLAAGKLVISRRFLAPVPLECLEYESTNDITLYSDIFDGGNE